MNKTKQEINDEIAHLKSEIKRLRNTIAELSQPLSEMLKRRGFLIYKKERVEDLLIPEKKHIDEYYEMLKKYSFRLFLRDVIKHQPSFTESQVTRYTTREVAARYIEFIRNIGLIAAENGSFRLKKAPVKSFGETLEWFVAEVFKREFASEAIWGVKMKRPLIGGDYDLLTKVDNVILYMEIKSSPPKQIYQKEITFFLKRVYDLAPEIAIFFMDTELRMKDKIVPMFEDELRERFQKPPKIERMEKELFEIQTERPKIFIINARDSIINNIDKVLVRYFRRSNE